MLEEQLDFLLHVRRTIGSFKRIAVKVGTFKTVVLVVKGRTVLVGSFKRRTV